MERGILYLCIHKRLHDKVGLSGIMSKKDFNVTVLARTYHVPKKYWTLVLKEMVGLNMVEDLGIKKNSYIKVLERSEEIEKEMDDKYRKSGLF